MQPGPVIRGINGLQDRALGVTNAALTITLGESATQIWPIVVHARQQYSMLLGMDYLSKVGATADFANNLYEIGGFKIRQQQDRLEIMGTDDVDDQVDCSVSEEIISARGYEESASSGTSMSTVQPGALLYNDLGSVTEYFSLQGSQSSDEGTEYHECDPMPNNTSDNPVEIWHDAIDLTPLVDTTVSVHCPSSTDLSFHTANSGLLAQPNNGENVAIQVAGDMAISDSVNSADFASAKESLTSKHFYSIDSVSSDSPRMVRDQGMDAVDGESSSVSSASPGEFDNQEMDAYDGQTSSASSENTGEFEDALESDPSSSASDPHSDYPDPDLSNTSFESSATIVTSTQHSDPTFSSIVSEIFVSSSTSNEEVQALMASPVEQTIQCNSVENVSHAPRPRLRMEPKDFLSEVDINPHLSCYQRSCLQSVLRENAELFSEDILTFPMCPVLKHEIQLQPNARPFRVKKLKRFSHAERCFIDSEIERLLQAGFIREFDGAWCAPITIAPKKNGSYRLCVAFCGLNRVTERLNHPLPNVQELLECAAGYNYYSSLDAQNAFHSLELTQESQPLTCFTTGKANYCYCRMPFGLVNAPMSFARAIRKVLQQMEGRSCVSCFMDDVCVYANGFEEHLKCLNDTLRVLHSCGLRLNITKCHFGYNSVDFLGHQLSNKGIETDSHKIDAISKWKTPDSVTEIRRFLGFCNYYRNFIHGYSDITEPILQMTRKHQSTFQWSQAQNDSFHRLKEALSNAPVLAPPNFRKSFHLECDASEVAVASVLGQDRPIGYFSKTLSATERRYSTTDREFLSVVANFLHFRPYCHGSVTHCVTDHASVVQLAKNTQSTGRRARWADSLQEFDFTIEHRSGSQNQQADALSRSLADNPIPHELNSEDPTPAVIARFTSVAEDPFLSDIEHFLRTGEARGNTAKEKRRIRDCSRKFTLRDDQLLYLDLDGVLKICVPQQDTRALIGKYHNSSHWGRDLTLAAIRRLYWWRSMYRDISDFIKQCETRQSFGAGQRAALLTPVLTIQPLEILEIDFSGPIAHSATPYLVSATCCLTRWIECRPVTTTSTVNTIQFLQEQIFYRFGLPICVLTDRAQAFANCFTAFLRRLQIQHCRSSAEHPQTLGNEERSHGLVLQKVRQYLVEDPNSSWEEHLPRAVFAVNSRVSNTSPISPLESMVGISPRRPTELNLLARIQPTTNRIRAVTLQHAIKTIWHPNFQDLAVYKMNAPS
eukprot:g6244.t1